MIVIRGIKGESYARKIKRGIVDCRDILSALLEPPVTGYEYSDYYEKNMVKALTYFAKDKEANLNNPQFLISLLIDYFIPHIYLTYFHVLNENSVAWLENFDDDYKFIAVNIKLDKLTKTAIGDEYFGAKMTYVNSIRELKQDIYQNFYVACMCSMESLFENKRDMGLIMQIYNTLFFPLLCREQDEKFTDIENEFRIIAYDCPRIEKGIMKQIPRDVLITGGTGVKYRGVLNAGQNTIFESDNHVLRTPHKLLSDVVFEEQGRITLDSRFKSIDISTVSDDFRYLGGKTACEDFIKRALRNMPKEEYVDRTVRRTYRFDELKNVAFATSHHVVEY